MAEEIVNNISTTITMYNNSSKQYNITIHYNINEKSITIYAKKLLKGGFLHLTEPEILKNYNETSSTIDIMNVGKIVVTTELKQLINDTIIIPYKNSIKQVLITLINKSDTIINNLLTHVYLYLELVTWVNDKKSIEYGYYYSDKIINDNNLGVKHNVMEVGKKLEELIIFDVKNINEIINMKVTDNDNDKISKLYKKKIIKLYKLLNECFKIDINDNNINSIKNCINSKINDFYVISDDDITL
ncbi:MAG: hypothetical protein ACP5RS_06585 [Thermoplasmata archaeon]